MTKETYKTNYRLGLFQGFGAIGIILSGVIIEPYVPTNQITFLEVLGTFMFLIISAGLIGLIGYVIGLILDIHYKLSKGDKK